MALRWKALFQRRRMERELALELEDHLEERVAQLRGQGLSEQEARRQAKLRFGSASAHKESARESWGWEWLHALMRDLRYGVRVLSRDRSFTFASVSSLAIGLGASTAMFAVLYGVLLAPLPFSQYQRIYRIFESEVTDASNREMMSVSMRMLHEMDQRLTTLESVTSATPWNPLVLEGQDWAHRLRGAQIDSNFFRVFPVQPVLGRLPGVDRWYTEDHNTVLLSYSHWQSRYGEDPSVLGQRLEVEGHTSGAIPLTIIGVLPPDFRFPTWRLKDTNFWMPYRESWQRPDADWRVPNSDTFVLLPRDGSIVAAKGEIAALQQELGEAYPTLRNLRPTLEPMQLSYAERQRTPLYLLFGASLALAMLCCLNIMNLLVARTLKMREELGVRRALGAGNAAILRQLLTESGLICAAGTAAGAVLALGIIQLFRATMPAMLPYLDRISLQTWVIFFLLGGAVLTMTLASLAPMLFALRTKELDHDSRAAARVTRSGSGSRWARKTLLASQVGLSLLLLCASLLLLANLNRTVRDGFQFAWQDVTCVHFTARPGSPDGEIALSTYRAFADELSSSFGSKQWAMADNAPILPMAFGSNLVVKGAEEEVKNRDYNARNVSPEYFSFLGVRLLAGRLLDESDHAGSEPVAVVSNIWAERCLGLSDAVGVQFRVSRKEDAPWITVVGIVEDVKNTTNFSRELGTLYRPIAQVPFPHRTILLRTLAPVEQIDASVRQAVIAAGLPRPQIHVERLSDYVWEALELSRFFTVVLSVFALIAVLLAGIGVYGVLQYYGVQRSREFGIRAAIGATRQHLQQLVLRQAALPVLAGLAVGVVTAGWLSRYLESILHTVQPLEPGPYIAAVLFLGATALLAGWLPARRAAHVDPAQCLRSE